MKKYTLDEVKDRFIGESGTAKRDQYETDLQLEVIGALIKTVRKERNLTQGQLGELIGVQKAQISKLENNAKNVSIGTIIRVFEALKAKVKLTVEISGEEVECM
ncbi:transcriptional regulator [Flavilitoribacter nigricans DSM 23189 = NBRC 102662]|uniref:Transcriptional regulator n=2 Tax=Flavilitoribacter TaxID=2762562 RepID=A0A2D0N4V8_FLAN2|nr:transcriptional regulator [Flavilitoribacter nigricans DSM 23189 = NBRC 102662]